MNQIFNRPDQKQKRRDLRNNMPQAEYLAKEVQQRAERLQVQS